MNDNPHSTGIDELIDRYVTGELSEEQADRLLRLSEQDAEVGLRILRQTQLDFLLQDLAKKRKHQRFSQNARPDDTALAPFDSAFEWDAGSTTLRQDATMDELARSVAESAELFPNASSSRPLSEAARRSTVSPTILVTILSALILWSFLAYREWNPATNEQVDRSASYETPAIVVSTDDVRWSDGTRAPRLGDPLLPGSLRFESGTVELLFYSGVRCVVEGPAELLLVDEKRAFCTRGRWSVTVPKQGSGFEIQTPGLTIRDIGTQFFADIKGGKSQLHVVRGIVETENPVGETVRLETAQAAVFRGSELLDRMASNISLFVTKSEMRLRSDAFFKRSVPLKPGLPGPFRSIDFGPYPVPDAPSDAICSGGLIVEGRRPEKFAFQFSDKTDRIRLRSAGSQKAVTAVLWMKIDRLGDEFNPILMSEQSSVGGLVWHVLKSGKFVVGVRTRSSRTGIFETPVVFTDEYLGRWVSMAWSVDTERREMTVYMDGDPVFYTKLPNLGKIDLNAVDIGSWKVHAGEDSMVRRIDGNVAEIRIFDRILTLAEIRQTVQRAGDEGGTPP